MEEAYAEMHSLAYVYHWSRESLWNIPVRERKFWHEMVLEQKRAESESVENSGNSSKSSYREST